MGCTVRRAFNVKRAVGEGRHLWLVLSSVMSESVRPFFPFLASSPNKDRVRDVVPSTAVTSVWGIYRAGKRELEQGLVILWVTPTWRPRCSSRSVSLHEESGPTQGEAGGSLMPPRRRGLLSAPRGTWDETCPIGSQGGDRSNTV